MSSPPAYTATRQSESRRNIRRAETLPRKKTEEAIRLLVGYGHAATHREALEKVKEFCATPADLDDFIVRVRRGRLHASDPSIGGPNWRLHS